MPVVAEGKLWYDPVKGGEKERKEQKENNNKEDIAMSGVKGEEKKAGLITVDTPCSHHLTTRGVCVRQVMVLLRRGDN